MSSFEKCNMGGNRFVMEASLSLLTDERLKRLKRAGCVMVAPGIESWVDYSKKSRTTRVSGEEKYKSISSKVREIEETLPAVQVNLILGVDADKGSEPFELTKRFIVEHPKVWANVNIPIPFGRTPFAERVAREERLISKLPFSFYTAPYLALRPRNYDVREYLEKLIDVYETMTSRSLLLRRLKLMNSNLLRGVTIARTAALYVELNELRQFAKAVSENNEMRRFHEGGIQKLPEFYEKRLRARLGRFHKLLPPSAHHPVMCSEEPIHTI
jgi:hypothetical protein